MAKKEIKHLHVVARTDGWAVKGEGRRRAVSVHSTQRDAIVAARTIARGEKGEVVIHGRDGRIRDRDSYGSDPFPPKSPRQVLFPATRSRAKEREIREAIKDVREGKR